MRTTLTLEPDVALKIRRRMAETKASLKKTVNDALRAGLSDRHPRSKVGFQVEPHACGFKPGVDLDKLNQLADELEAEASRRKLSGRTEC